MDFIQRRDDETPNFTACHIDIFTYESDIWIEIAEKIKENYTAPCISFSCARFSNARLQFAIDYPAHRNADSRHVAHPLSDTAIADGSAFADTAADKHTSTATNVHAIGAGCIA